MLFVPAPHHRRHHGPAILNDGKAKAILSRADLSWMDGGLRVQGRIIGWKRTDNGTLGAIVAYPITGARHLFRVNMNNGRAKHLCRLA